MAEDYSDEEVDHVATISEDIQRISDNDETMTVFNHTDYSGALDPDQFEALADALSENKTVEELLMDNAGVETLYLKQLCEALKTNECLKLFDVKYNRFGVEGFYAIADMLAVNTTLEIVKCDFQKVLPGPEGERRLAAVFDTNTTLLALRIRCNEQTNKTNIMNGEVRNKQIMKRKLDGKDWSDLDPARRDERAKEEADAREAERKAAEEAEAPITVKVENCGGPYTYKELTCLIEYQPDDVEKGKKEQYLGDEEFMELFGCTKDEYNDWPKWKKKNKKKLLNIH